MPKYALITLGCPKNLVDSEQMAGQLQAAGYAATEDPSQADVVLVNTCSFINPAKEESINTLLELAAHKTGGRAKALVATGCLSQRYRDDLATLMPEVDAWVGTGEFGRIASIVGAALTGKGYVHEQEPWPYYQEDLPRIIMTPRHWSYIKIAEGCNHTCAFCIIPALRGRVRSRKMEDVVAEARRLAEAGVKEIVLISQDSTDYGRDLYQESRLGPLLRDLATVDGIEWIRVMYAYPTSITDALLEAIADEPKVCKYLDMPLQHCEAAVLKRMRRPGSRRAYEALLERVRTRVPGVGIRTSFIVGFPGETEGDFDHLCEFVHDAQFDRVGVFKYSHEENTPSFDLADQLPERVKSRRHKRLMELQQPISAARNAALVGRRLPVLVDEDLTGGATAPAKAVKRDTEAEGLAGGRRRAALYPRYLGRTRWDAPEVDGQVFIMEGDARPGDLVTVEITAAQPYDLEGRIVAA